MKQSLFVEELFNLKKLSSLEMNNYLIPYGDGNPYYYCKYCEQSNVDISTQGHRTGCKLTTLESDKENTINNIKIEFNKAQLEERINDLKSEVLEFEGTHEFYDIKYIWESYFLSLDENFFEELE